VDLPRVAFFTDTFEQINGVALTSRQFVAYAERHQLPFLCVREGGSTRVRQEGSVTHVELRRGPLAFSLDKGLRYDPALWRHSALVRRELERFSPDIIHTVSPGDISVIGAWQSKGLRCPRAISWHTNLHEFGALRLDKLLRILPASMRHPAVKLTERQILEACLLYYRLGDVLYAPNDELVDMLRARTGKPVFLMTRGIDQHLFNPCRRNLNDGILRIGYVGRLTPEKSVHFLRDLQIGLKKAGAPPFRFLIVGDGSEKNWLARELENADLPGIHRNEELARDYANMDVFAFPSRTDTFGNVVLEAFASGVPAVVTDAGGPKFIVRNGVSGFVARSDEDFIACTARLLNDSDLRRRMSAAARLQASAESWDEVFDKVYDGYTAALPAKTLNVPSY
jgi:glycosyltransferase involved in cell wall biosynthesis